MPFPSSSSKHTKSIPIADHHEQMRMLRNQHEQDTQGLRLELARRDDTLRSMKSLLAKSEMDNASLVDARDRALACAARWRKGAGVIAQLLAAELATGKD